MTLKGQRTRVFGDRFPSMRKGYTIESCENVFHRQAKRHGCQDSFTCQVKSRMRNHDQPNPPPSPHKKKKKRKRNKKNKKEELCGMTTYLALVTRRQDSYEAATLGQQLILKFFSIVAFIHVHRFLC